jgi:hypothetical protein
MSGSHLIEHMFSGFVLKADMRLATLPASRFATAP